VVIRASQSRRCQPEICVTGHHVLDLVTNFRMRDGWGRLFGENKSVLRGGYARAYDHLFNAAFLGQDQFGSFPFVKSVSLSARSQRTERSHCRRRVSHNR